MQNLGVKFCSCSLGKGGFNATGSISKPLECLRAEYLKNRGESFKVLGGNVAVVKRKTPPDSKKKKKSFDSWDFCSGD